MKVSRLVFLRRAFVALLLVAGLALLWLDVARAAAGPPVRVLQLNGTVNPVMAGYITRGIQRAEEEQVMAVVIEIDTPGGLDTSMREIVQGIVNARVPVITWVAPAGARAASAGMFIVMAGHIAAMAPNTAIGAAHPVSLGNSTQGGQDKVMESKVEADAAAYARSIAELRGRNKEWAENAVRLPDPSKGSATADEALKLNVIDLTAKSRDELLEKVDGRKVHLFSGDVTLRTRLAPQEVVEMSPIEGFLFAISNPNVAFILLSLAMIGLFFELANPGAILPGVVGGVLLLLALYSLGSLDVNWTGLLLIAFAFLLFLAEIFVTSHGVLAVGGIVSLALGAMLLFSKSPLFALDLRLLGGMSLALLAYFVFVVVMVRRAHQQRVTVGGVDALIGRTAVARTDLAPQGYVFIEGERWLAQSEGEPVKEGDPIVITKVEGMKMWVAKAHKKEEKE
ncbi:MAG: nodulation protein NfeD [Chloroflexi bacterium]|nr:nodulation protein NfeD [Chloroflexota bacterium]